MLDTAYLEKLYSQYSKEKVEEALRYLSYRNPSPLPKASNENPPTMFVFRHGQSTDNEQMLFSGWRDVEITELGKKQALILAEKLKNKKIHMLISSTQKRAIQTMKIAISLNEYAKNLEIHTDERIKERSYGDLEGTSKLEYQLKDPDGLFKLRRNFYTIPPNGESLEMVCKRVKDFCDEIIPLMKKENINVAISCHGNSIRGFRYYFENLSEEETALVETPLGQDYASYKLQ